MQGNKETETEELPPNWTSRLDTRYNRRYYYNKLTKQSSWTKPPLETVSEVPSQKEEERKDLAAITDSSGDIWVPVYSKSYQRYYYYNQKSGATTWNHPLKSKGGETKVRKIISSKQSKPKSVTKASVLMQDEFGDESDDEIAEDLSVGKTGSRKGHDPEAFQTKMMQQFPALKKAFQELEEGQKRLQRDRAEHEERVRREMEAVNLKLEELRRLSDTISSVAQKSENSTAITSEGETNSVDLRRPSISYSRPRKLTLEQDLRRYSMDLERRSVTVVEKRKSMRTASGVGKDDLKSVMEEANRLAAERGNAPATAESAAAQMTRISAQFSGTLQIEQDQGVDEELQEIASEMDGVQKGLEYAMKEAEAQNEAAEEVRAAGDENEYYRMLEVTSEATEAELKKGYRRKLIEWHPDKVRPDKRDQAVRMTDVIQNAFKVLSDPWEREIYDWFGFQQYLLHVKVLACFKNYLIAGIELIKHPRKGRPRKRVVWLDQDSTEILTFRKKVMDDQRTGKEKVKGISIKSVTDVTTGRATDVLKRTGRASHSERYFSLICADRSLDFECPSEESCSFIATRMKLLIIDLKRDKEWMHKHYDELDQAT